MIISMSIMVVAGLILLQVLVYSAGVCVLFHEKERNIRWGIFTFVICMGIYYILDLPVNTLYVHAISIIILWSLLKNSIREKFSIIIKCVFIITCCEEIMEVTIDKVLQNLLDKPIRSQERFIFVNLSLMIVWLIVAEVKKRNIRLKRKYTNSLIMTVMVIMAIALALIIASIQYAAPYVDSKRFSMISDILTVISYLDIVILGLFVIYIGNANENFKNLLDTERLLRKAQKSNYEVILAKEAETREFRHDFSNHILCLKELISKNNIAEAADYIDQMQSTVLQIQKKTYTTGNEIIDAILNYYVRQLKKDVEVSVIGLCNDNLNVNDVELCSIVSNPLQNAVEALNNQKRERKYLKIRMNSTTQNFKMVICNSFDKDNIAITDGLPVTIKQDKENHGIGLKNVKKLVENNKGLFNIEIQEDEFRITLILPVRYKNIPLNKLSDR